MTGLRLRDLGERLLVKPPSVTTLVERLVRAGLVERTTAESDQRAKLVALTARGRKLVQRVLQHHPAQMRAMLAGLSEAEQEQLRRLMEQLAASLEAREAAGLSEKPISKTKEVRR